MFSDPQSITYATVAKSLVKIGQGQDQSEYKLNDSGGIVYDLILGHQFKARNRAFARLRRDSVQVDPLIPAQNIPAGMTATLTLDYPSVGLANTDVQALANALTAFCSSANILKLINGET